MDNLEIHDTRLQNLNNSALLGHLLKKSHHQPQKRPQSIQTSISTQTNSKINPKFSFTIVNYQINQHVEYLVQMQESFKILGRKVTNNIQFKTRYSMLQKLNEKIGSKSFPPKRFFGNKDKKFVGERKKQLEYFLNKISSGRSVEFLRFVKQIKEADFNKELNKEFEI